MYAMYTYTPKSRLCYQADYLFIGTSIDFNVSGTLRSTRVNALSLPYLQLKFSNYVSYVLLAFATEKIWSCNIIHALYIYIFMSTALFNAKLF